jgi:hypothetical protein
LDVERDDKLHDLEVSCNVPWAKLILFFQNLHKFLVVIHSIQQFLQKLPVLLGASFDSILYPFSDDLSDFFGFDFGQVDNGHVHSTFSPFLQFIQKSDIFGEHHNGDVSLGIGVIQPFADVI